jgi:hypothetical protein
MTLESIKKDPSSIPLWQVIVGKYHPTFLRECEFAIEWSKEIAISWLETGMFLGESGSKDAAKKIVDSLADHTLTKTHSRHMSAEECKKLGLKILNLESDQELQDIILTVHHCYMHTFANSTAIKITENQNGIALVNHARPTP